jgi:hypothetical protein
VLEGDAKLAVRWDVKLLEVCGHSAARCWDQVAVVPGAGVIVSGPEEAGQRAAKRVEKALWALVLGVGRHLAVVTQVCGDVGEW